PWRRRLAVLAAAVAVYAALGFLVAPPLLRRSLVEELSAALQRRVSIAQVAANPFALSVSVRGLEVADRDGAPLLRWSELYLRLRPWSVVDRELGLAEVRLHRPALRVALGKDGKPTFADLLERPAAGPAPAGRPPGSGWGLYLGRLSVDEASIALVDGTREPPFEKTLGPVSFRLERFRTRPGSQGPYAFSGVTESGERFSWAGELGADPPGSTGTLAFEKLRLAGYQAYTREEAAAEVRAGLATLRARYQLAWGEARRVVRLADASLEVEGLRLGRPGVAEDDVALPSLSVAGASVDALAPSVAVGRVAVRGGRVRLLRQADGSLNLAQLAAEAPAGESAPPAAGGAPGPAPPPAPFAWSVGALSVQGLRLEWEDAVPARPATLALDPVGLEVKSLSSDPAAAWPFAATIGWPGGGSLALEGSAAPLVPRAEASVDIRGLELSPVAPYLDGGPARLAGGKLTAKGKASWDGRAATPGARRASFAGTVRLDGLRALDPARGEEVLRWRALELAGLEASASPLRVRLRSARIQEPRLRIVRVEEPAVPAPAPRPAPGPAPGAAAQLSIGGLEIRRGEVAFVDRTVEPPVALEVSEVEVRVADLSTDTRTRSTVDARMKVLGASPLTVTGTLNPLQTGAHTDLAVLTRAVDLVPLSPYAGKHLGYELAKGKVDLDIRVRVQDRRLVGSNVARLDQLELGDETDSPDAVSIPVRLALAVLRDRNGLIVLDVPVEGGLDDPEFRLGRVIGRALLNVLTKVATSPFAALAALAGGGDDDLSVVDLQPGDAEPGEVARRRIGVLAKALVERPGLSLELEATVDEAADRAALQRRAFEEQRARTPPDPKARPPAPEEVARLVAAVPIPPEALAGLASERAERSRAAFLDAGIDPSRLFLVRGGERASRERGARVYFTLR
ncbi:MAG TPA: DUF748 domain-containing protein, partial [Anaeromyxobacteraceae bacterium]